MDPLTLILLSAIGQNIVASQLNDHLINPVFGRLRRVCAGYLTGNQPIPFNTDLTKAVETALLQSLRTLSAEVKKRGKKLEASDQRHWCEVLPEILTEASISRLLKSECSRATDLRQEFLKLGHVSEVAAVFHEAILAWLRREIQAWAPTLISSSEPVWFASLSLAIPCGATELSLHQIFLDRLLYEFQKLPSVLPFFTIQEVSKNTEILDRLELRIEDLQVDTQSISHILSQLTGLRQEIREGFCETNQVLSDIRQEVSSLKQESVILSLGSDVARESRDALIGLGSNGTLIIQQLASALVRELRPQLSSPPIQGDESPNPNSSPSELLLIRGRERLKEGRLEGAKALFEEAIREFESAPSPNPKTLASAYANLGLCHYYQCNSDHAKEAIQKAVTLDQESPRIQISSAIIESGEEGEHCALDTLRRLYANNPTERNLVETIAGLISSVEGASVALTFLRQNRTETEGWFVHAVQFCLQTGDTEGARVYLAELEKLAPDSAETLYLQALLAVTGILPSEPTSQVPYYGLDTKRREAVEHAIDVISQAVQKAREGKHKRNEGILESVKGAWELTVGRYQDARTSLVVAKTLHPRNSDILNNLYYAHLELGEYPEAANVARELCVIEATASARSRYTAALLLGGDAQAAFREVQDTRNAFPSANDDTFLLSLEMECCLRLQKRDHALQIAEGLRVRISDAGGSDPSLPIAVGYALVELGDPDGAKAVFSQAAASDAPRVSFYGKIALTEVFHAHAQWNRCVEAFESIPGSRARSPVVELYARALYETEEYERCLTLAAECRDEHVENANVWRIEAAVYSILGDFAKAKGLFTRLVERTNRIEDRIALADVEHRSGDLDSARQVLEGIRTENPRDSFVLANLAGISYHQGSHEQAFRLAKEAHRLNPEFVVPMRVIIALGTVSTSVLQLNGEDQKLVAECLERCPDIERIRVVDAAGDFDPSPIFEKLSQRSRRAAVIQGLYSKHQMPLDFFAELIGEDLWDLWWRMTRNGSPIYSGQGSKEEQDRELTCAQASREIVIDFVSLCTMRLLNLLPVVEGRFDKIVVPSTVNQEFRRRLSEARNQKAPSAFMWKEGERFHIREIDEKETEEQRAFLEDIVAFLDSPKLVIGGIGPTELRKWKSEQPLQAMRREAFFPIGVAATQKRPLLSDQLWSRQILMHSFKQESFSTQALLRDLVSKEFLSRPEYSAATITLIRSGYGFISTDVQTILQLAVTDNTPGFVAERIFGQLSSASCHHASTPALVGAAIANIWRHSPPLCQKREEWIKCMCRHLANSQAFAQASAYLIRAGIQIFWRNPASYFGLMQAIAQADEFSREQRRAFKERYRIAALNAANQMRSAVPYDVDLLRRWGKQIRAEELLIAATQRSSGERLSRQDC